MEEGGEKREGRRGRVEGEGWKGEGGRGRVEGGGWKGEGKRGRVEEGDGEEEGKVEKKGESRKSNVEGHSLTVGRQINAMGQA